MHGARWAAVGVALAAGLVGCAGDDPVDRTDAGVGADAGTSADSGARDGGPGADAGGAGDAGAGLDAGARDAGVALDAGACTDDAREDDDTIAAAMAMTPIYSLTGSTTLDSLASCPGDDDYYYAYSDCCMDAFGAELRWAPTAGSLELSIVDASGAPIAVNVDETTAGNRRLLQTSPSASTYFFARVHNAGSTSVPYTLVVYAFVFGP